MKAALIRQYGTDALKLEDVPQPSPAPDQVLVEIHAASVNPFDWKVRDGLYKETMPVSFPAILGGDLAGIVAQVGDEVTNFNTGDKVYGQANALGHGSFAEFSSVKASQLALMPSNLDYIKSASLPLAAVSAYQALIEEAGLKSDQKILIHGGAGGIGYIAIQIAKNIGAYVGTTVSAAHLDFARQLGVNQVVDYGSEDFTKIFKDFDVVFDTVGGSVTSDSYKVLKKGGMLVSMVAQPDTALAKETGVKFVSMFTRTTTERLTKIKEMVEAERLNPHIDKVFSFNEITSAMDYQKTSHPAGKVVVQIKA
ncbi:MAG TPA: NADP-dependent oxidoreductase [Candidatus Saccharimonadales bacterium]|nr:NADP-dependent oxidoreductase [Candidatus Saccharimonadales bacterium]